MTGNKALTDLVLSIAESQAKLVEWAQAIKLAYTHWYPFWLELRHIQDEVIELNKKVSE